MTILHIKGGGGGGGVSRPSMSEQDRTYADIDGQFLFYFVK